MVAFPRSWRYGRHAQLPEHLLVEAEALPSEIERIETFTQCWERVLSSMGFLDSR